MAVDEVLLKQAAHAGVAAIRLYQWREPTLSLGYFQQYHDRRMHGASRACPVVRRPSGGGAIVHDHELTYSIVLPAAHRLARAAEELYFVVHTAFIKVLQRALIHFDLGCTLRLRESVSPRPPGREPFLCFERAGGGDVVLKGTGGLRHSGAVLAETEAAREFKILGSAQRRLRGAILQHGSLLLAASPAAPELRGFNDLTGLDLAFPPLASELSARMPEILGIEPGSRQLDEELRARAEAIGREKYDLPAWNKRR